jgi:hypothetical protein
MGAAGARSLPVPRLAAPAGLVAWLALSMVSHIPIRSICATPSLAVTRVFDKDPSSCELGSETIRTGPVARRSGGGTQVEQRLKFGAELVVSLRRNRQNAIELAYESGRATCVGGRELSGIDPPVQFSNQVEYRPQRR